MEKKLNFRNLPAFGAVAIDPNDLGVLECFIAVLVAMVESFGEKYKIGKNSDEIRRITEKLEKNLREYVNRDEPPKGPRTDTEEVEPGKFVIKPNPKRGNIMRS